MPDYNPADIAWLRNSFAIRLVETCWSHAEQYDAFLDGRQVGYLRLRHGQFRVGCPECGGETVYQSEPIGDGEFEADERETELMKARACIATWLPRPVGFY
jgi:hypothetical protein